MIAVCSGPLPMTERMRAGLIACTPTTMRRAASVGIATRPTSPDAASTRIAMTPAAMNRASRVRAPEAATMTEVDIEPPTGIPRNSPDTRLPVPCPMKLREASAGLPSGFGTAAATAAPCTRPMRASDRAGTSR